MDRWSIQFGNFSAPAFPRKHQVMFAKRGKIDRKDGDNGERVRSAQLLTSQHN
jgi:hypothetical protein